MDRSYASNSQNSHGQYYEYGEWILVVYCHCNHKLKLQTSWTKANPGRRFWQCPMFKREVSCGFMQWFDQPMSNKPKMIIPGLLTKINCHEEEIQNLTMQLQESEKMMKNLKLGICTP
ncbi:unnamed protein product [Cuscuta europaea]|uniref:GRF-type domain-containing protein n=1 Tax=Cuscuta europaea TaxID=41803 RepID=A0A9P0ZD89_CUSEU|nr:unnamed protein product [Cuscuta europaea]